MNWWNTVQGNQEVWYYLLSMNWAGSKWPPVHKCIYLHALFRAVGKEYHYAQTQSLIVLLTMVENVLFFFVIFVLIS